MKKNIIHSLSVQKHVHNLCWKSVYCSLELHFVVNQPISTFHFPTGQNSTRLAAGWICRFSTSQQCPISQQEVPTSNDSVQNWHKVSYSDKMDLKKSNQTKNLTFCQILRCFLSDLSGLPSRKKKDKSAKEVQPSSWRSQLESASQLSMSWWSCIAIYTPKTITKENQKKTNGS